MFVRPRWRAEVAVAGAIALVAAWWLTIRPSNRYIAEHAYELRAIDTSLPFAELKRLSYIDYRAREADDDPNFSSLIRKGLPGTP